MSGLVPLVPEDLISVSAGAAPLGYPEAWLRAKHLAREVPYTRSHDDRHEGFSRLDLVEPQRSIMQGKMPSV